MCRGDTKLRMDDDRRIWRSCTSEKPIRRRRGPSSLGQSPVPISASLRRSGRRSTRPSALANRSHYPAQRGTPAGSTTRRLRRTRQRLLRYLLLVAQNGYVRFGYWKRVLAMAHGRHVERTRSVAVCFNEKHYTSVSRVSHMMRPRIYDNATTLSLPVFPKTSHVN